MADSAFSLVGRQVGRIRIIAEAGHGAMSSVYVGVDEKLDRQVAVKAIARRFRVDPEARAQFLFEARVLSSLDHPGVCQIHDYIEADDVDLLVMELVEGRRLSEVMATAVTRARQLDIAGQLLDVLSVVHENGIVHRDLKADNVMITASGAVKVLDFGIASLEATATEEKLSRAVLGSAVASDEQRRPRQTGIYGTLRSMSPEQARGEAVTPASDIYSLGLLLQELFTGLPPLERDLPTPVLLAKAAAGDTRAVEGLEPQLTTLIERMKSVAPGARPSARDAAAQLQAVIDRPRRRRRRRIVAGVWAVLVVLSVSLAVQSVRARREASRASAARAEAEELVEFILEDLHETLQPLGRLDLIAEITEEALDYYDRRSEGQFEPAELNRQARGLNKLCVVLEGLGRLTEAEKAQERSVAIRREMVALDPDHRGRRILLAWALVDLERVLDYQGHRVEAAAALEEAGQLADTLIDDEEFATLAATVKSAYWDRVGSQRCADGDLAGCVEAFAAALELDAGVHAADADEASRWNLALSRSRVAELHLVRGDLGPAREGYEAAIELVTDAPGDADWQDLISDFQAGLAEVLLAEGSAEAAVVLQRRVLEQRSASAEHDPTNLLSRHRSASALSGLGEALYQQGDLRAAARLLGQAADEARRVSARDPDDVVYLLAMADALAADARVRGELGRWREARELLAEAVTVSRDLYRRDPANRAWTVGLADYLTSLGEAEAASGQRSEARQRWREAEGLINSLASRSDHPEYRLVWARTLALLGETEEAAALVRELPASYGQRREVRRWCRGAGLSPPGR